MKSCDPRRWLEARLLLGLASILLVFGVVLSITSNVIAGAACAGLLLIVDAVCHYGGARPKWRQIDVTMWCDAHDSGAALVEGTTADLTAHLECDRAFSIVTVSILLPPAVKATEHTGRRFRVRSGSKVLLWSVRFLTPGEVIVPGLVFTKLSPFGLFRTITINPARLRLYVEPQFRGVATDPALMRTRTPASADRRWLAPGGGTDFRELRKYVPLDPLNRIDWKATARRGELIVREMDEPREFSIGVVLDVSCDLLYGLDGQGEWFIQALSFLDILTCTAQKAGFNLNVVLYDSTYVHRLRSTAASSSRHTIAAQLSMLPRMALARQVARAPEVHDRLAKLARQRLNAWGVCQRDDEVFLRAYFESGESVATLQERFVIETQPDSILDLHERCNACRSIVYPDESACPKCGATIGDGSMPPRAASALAAMAEAVRVSHGRQLLVFVSSLLGGETSPEFIAALRRVHTPFRSVHVVTPSAADLMDADPRWPGTLGHAPVRRNVLRDIDRLNQAVNVATFHRALSDDGIPVHAIEDPDDLLDVVSGLIRGEAHAELRGR